ncbi:ABC transporter ATP-binding protein [Ancylobacter amanitiformis]|uniref:Branched-chain amino acid transport system ATP-binding protein n=1 Tax=Ancylobacter amanitiformis TaxID=217069 RepID=A0ABU0LLS8_9HYPH|nr:ABC transporter ATP-binding protein [Ancylobacter amanitiformis]MDQ0509627.1 branched-chain amino acid transport system ATP-binding protein [Ancylobacter amanitiformis]
MLLQVRELKVGYASGADVLRGVDLSVGASSVTGLIGANGAGKSTLLKTICGFLRRRGGAIAFDAADIGKLQPSQLAAHGIAYLMEGHSVFPGLTVEENLILGTWAFRKERARAKQAVERAFELSSVLRAKRKVKAGLLSGGQQRILEMERLTLNDPRLVILDEPSLGLSPKLVHEVFERIAQMKADGAGVLVVDQSARHVCAASDHLYVLRLGEICIEGPAASFSDRIDELVRNFI